MCATVVNGDGVTTMPGKIVLARAQLRITVFLFVAFRASTFLRRFASMYGPFFADLDILFSCFTHQVVATDIRRENPVPGRALSY
jgi:hypothetical protein